MSNQEHVDLLAELTRLETMREQQVHKDKRRFKRFVARGDAELYPIDPLQAGAVGVPAGLRDVGRGGIGFITQKPLEVGGVWRVCFMSHGYVIGQQAALIRHAQPVRGAVQLIGAEFCIDTGLLVLLGLSASELAEELAGPGDADFVSPD